MILLDSDVAIDILRRHPPALAWIRAQNDRVCLPGIVALHNVPLHTFNQKHFAAIPALQTIQPYTR